MGKWMSFFLFILCSGKSGVLGSLVIFENVGRILSDSPASTFETGWFCHWSIIYWFLFFFDFLFWFSTSLLVFSVDIVSGTVWTHSESGNIFFFSMLVGIWDLIFISKCSAFGIMSSDSIPSKSEVLNWDSQRLADFLKKVSCFLFLCFNVKYEVKLKTYLL